MSQEIRAYTGGVGRKVHAGAIFNRPEIRNGEGVIALCGVFERPAGSWVAHETESPVDCPECKAAMDAHSIVVAKPSVGIAVVKIALDPTVWGAFAESLVVHSRWAK